MTRSATEGKWSQFHLLHLSSIYVYTWRRQEIVLIGTNLDEARVRAQLDACLLSDEEYASGNPELWCEQLEDPFPASDFHDEDTHHHDDEEEGEGLLINIL